MPPQKSPTLWWPQSFAVGMAHDSQFVSGFHGDWPKPSDQQLYDVSAAGGTAEISLGPRGRDCLGTSMGSSCETVKVERKMTPLHITPPIPLKIMGHSAIVMARTLGSR